MSNKRGRSNVTGRPPKLQGPDIELLRTLFREQPSLSAVALAKKLADAGGPQVSDTTVLKVLRAQALVGPAQARPEIAAVARRRLLLPEHVEVLRDLVTKHPLCTLSDLARWLLEAGGPAVSNATISKALREAGIVQIKPESRPTFSPPPAKPPRYGYTDKHRDKGDAQRYATSLTDAEWALVRDLFEPEPGSVGKPATYSRRSIVDACSYAVRTGCSWRLLPKCFPHWDSVYKTFRRWTTQGKFELMHDRLREQWRLRENRNVSPTVAVVDSQSTRTSPQGGEKGFDAGKRVKGRKRNLIVDTLGLVLAVVITPANVQDRDGAHPAVAMACQKYATLKTLYADSAYAGTCADQLRTNHNLDVQIIRHPGNRNVGQWHDTQLPLFDLPTPAFIVAHKRWIVERQHAWIERARRLVMHHDRRIDVCTSWVWFTEARRLLRDLTYEEPPKEASL